MSSISTLFALCAVFQIVSLWWEWFEDLSAWHAVEGCDCTGALAALSGFLFPHAYDQHIGNVVAQVDTVTFRDQTQALSYEMDS